MGSGKKKQDYKKSVQKNKEKKGSELKTPKNGGLPGEINAFVEEITQDTTCDRKSKLKVKSDVSRIFKMLSVSKSKEDSKNVSPDINNVSYYDKGLLASYEMDTFGKEYTQNALLDINNESYSDKGLLPFLEMDNLGKKGTFLKIDIDERQNFACTKGKYSKNNKKATCVTYLDTLETVEGLSDSDKGCLNEIKVLSEHKLKICEINSYGNDYKRNSFNASVNLKDVIDQCDKSFSQYNNNEQNETCNKKIENKLMNEVLSSKNIKINSEAISIYIVDNIPRHPSRLGDIPWSWLNEEKWRLHTFSRYPYDAPKSAIILAAEGFAYIGTGKDSDDTVICFFCVTIKKKWQPSDDISQVHKHLSPCCSFVTKINCTNVPLETSYDGSLFCELFKPRVNKKRDQVNTNKERPLSNNFEAPERNIETDGASPFLEAGGINRNGSSQIEIDGALPSLVSVGTGRNESPQISSSDIPNNYIASQAVVNPNVTQQSSDRTSSSSLQNSEITTAQATAPSSILHADSIVSHSATPSPQRPITTAQSAITAGQGSNTATTAPATTAQDTTAQATTTLTTTAPTTTTQTGTGANSNLAGGNAGGPTYSELGIVTERPKRFEYALLAKRMETFLSWPRDHHLRPKELAEAGFYYAGYGDCARCFYCGGGLRNWEDEDDVWVEHARWFPKCAYIRQQMGQVFVDTVQELNKTNGRIFFTMVMEQIGHAASAFQLDSKDNPLKRDPAVKTILDMGYPLAEVIAVAETIKEDGNILSSDKIYEKLVAAKIKRNSNTINIIPSGTEGTEASITEDIKTMRTLKEKNNQLRQQTTCKICMDKEVAVVFLPCGHFVSCTDCAAAMKDCPVCRNHVKGIVRAFMG